MRVGESERESAKEFKSKIKQILGLASRFILRAKIAGR